MHWLVDVVLHLDRHLAEAVAQYHALIYAILFCVIFGETGLVVTPFLPGDSLLFATGALAAVDSTRTLSALGAWLLLAGAAVLGNSLNYAIGRAVGPRAFSTRSRWLNRKHLEQTEDFYRRYGAITLVSSRFIPIIRTFAPFVAGVARMRVRQFQLYNVAGGLAWTALFIWGGYLFGNVPAVKSRFGLVTLAIVAVSVLPIAWTAVKSRRSLKS